VLPGRSGIELADQIKALAPELPILLASGYAEERINYPLIRQRGYGFLHKPYSIGEMFEAVQNALAGLTPGDEK
jgi:FixJ family two-component response regulator